MPEGFIPDDAPEGFIPDEPAQPAPPTARAKTGVGEAIGYGAASGGSFDLADEAAGQGGALAGDVPRSKRGDFTGGNSAPIERTGPNPVAAAALATPLAPLAAAYQKGQHPQAYQTSRNAWRQDDARAAQDQPGAYYPAKVGAAVLTSAPVGGSAPVQATRLAAEGALGGYGASESDSATDQAKDAATGGTISLATGGMVRAGGRAAAAAAPRVQRFAENRRLAQAGIPQAQARDFPAGGPSGLVKRLQAQGVGTGVESRQKLLQQVELSSARNEATRAAAIPNPNAPAPNISQPLRDKAREFVGESAYSRGLKQQATAADAEAEALSAQGEALGLNRKFSRPDPAERMAAPSAPTDLAPQPSTGAGFKMRQAQPKSVVPPPVDRRATPRERTPADVMAGPANQRRLLKQVAAKRAQAAELRGRVPPEGQVGSGERGILDREADRFAADQPTMAELNEHRARYGRGFRNPKSAADEAQAYQAAHGIANDALEGSIEKAQPGAGHAWREAGRDEAANIQARNGLQSAMASTDRSPFMSSLRGGLAASAGGAVAGPPGAVAGWIADRLSRGREHAIAAYGAEQLLKVPSSPLGKILRGRNVTGNLASRAAEKVRQAATPEEAAREHFLGSSQSPDYHKAAYAEPTE